jgi:hypothetical protein
MLRLTQRIRYALGVPTRGDNCVARIKRSLGDIDTQPAAGSRDKPDFLLAHRYLPKARPAAVCRLVIAQPQLSIFLTGDLPEAARRSAQSCRPVVLSCSYPSADGLQLECQRFHHI